jgi:hypothetical protein
MNTAVPSVDQLKELALPAPISYLPHTWGWALLAVLLVLGALYWAARRYRRWRRNRYRREALQHLARLEQAMAEDTRRLPALRELPELLKRVALSMPDRPAVASLSGGPWQGFLDSHGDQPLPAGFSRQLSDLAYGPDSHLQALDSEQRQQLLDQCRHWVEHHHVAA